MKPAQEKYIPFVPLKMEHRSWPDKQITKAPIWCSVDLRDGNQALVDPMNLQEKLEYFHTLVDIGVKEIEIGFPSASETEYEICRELIEGGHIPDDVTIQVLVQAREHLIKKTFEAIKGAKNVILHFYNSTSTLQRKVVFHTDVEGVKKIAVDAAHLIRELSQPAVDAGMDLRYEYSPESFMGTEMDYAVEICQAVLEHLHATPENKVILNLPTTVENCMPNQFADMLEYFIRKLPSRDSAIISLHPHNDRGTGVATAEMGLLAGADRVEATLFGNGERTGNVDMVTLALNLYTQGVDPGLDFSNINKIRDVYEKVTKMKIGERQPYVGELVFTAFSGSHQDAINKGTRYMEESGTEYWEVPYLPIDPADVGREYEPIIRINSQSGKGGAAFVMQHSFGFDLPKDVIYCIAENLQSNVRQLEGTVKKIKAKHELGGEAITIDMTQKVIEEVKSISPGLNPTPPMILQTVSNFYSVPVDQILSDRRSKDTVQPRQMAMYLVRKMTNYSLPEIGKVFGRDHTTVMHACDKIDGDRKKNAELEDIIKTLIENIQNL